MINVEDLLACVIYGKILWVWVWKNFASMENFLWIWYFGYKNIFVGYVMLDHEKFVWLWFWICRNFCDCTWTWLMWEFFWWHGYGKILVVVYGHVKNFGCGKIWWAIDFFFFFFFVGHWLFWAHENFLDMCFWSWDFFFLFLSWEIFDHVVLVMENFLDMWSWAWEFWTCDFGHGNFLEMWFWSWEFFFGHVVLGLGIFEACDFSGMRNFGHGNFLDMWFWSWEFLIIWKL